MIKLIIINLLFLFFYSFADNFKPQIIANDLDEKYLNIYNITYKPLTLKYPKYHKINLPKAASTLYFAEDTTTKFYRVKIIFPIGSINDKHGKEGELYFTLHNMVTGGTKNFPKNTLDSLLDLYAINLNISVSSEFSSINLTCLKEYKKISLQILHEVLNEPLFNEEVLYLDKQYVKDYYDRILEDPNNFISLKFKELLYGKNGYSLPSWGDTNSIKKINLTVLKQKYKILKNIGGLTIGISANQTKIDAIKDAWYIIGDYKREKYNKNYFNIAIIKNPQTKAKLVFYDVKGLNQSFIRFGTRSDITYNSKDYYKNILMLEILGSGGFNSRFLNELRVKRGLCYSAGFIYRTNMLTKGDYVGYIQTRINKTYEALEVSYEVIKNFVEQGATEKEFMMAQNSIINSLPFLYDSPSSFLFLVLDYASKHRDIKNLYKLDKIYSDITLEDINKLAKKYLNNYKKFNYVIVGDWEVLKEEILKFANKHKLEVELKLINKGE